MVQVAEDRLIHTRSSKSKNEHMEQSSFTKVPFIDFIRSPHDNLKSARPCYVHGVRKTRSVCIDRKLEMLRLTYCSKKQIPDLPGPNAADGVLPKIMAGLFEQRKAIKNLMKYPFFNFFF